MIFFSGQVIVVIFIYKRLMFKRKQTYKYLKAD